MERRKITIARLRSGVNYKRPLDHIIDSFCYMLKRFQVKHDEFNYALFNLSDLTKKIAARGRDIAIQATVMNKGPNSS